MDSISGSVLHATQVGTLQPCDIVDLQRGLAELPLDCPNLTTGDMTSSTAHTAGLMDLYPAQDFLCDEDSDSDGDTEPEDWPEHFLTVPRRNMQLTVLQYTAPVDTGSTSLAQRSQPLAVGASRWVSACIAAYAPC